MSGHDGENVEQLRAERDRALVALWRIRMAAERSNMADPPGHFENTVVHLALGGMGQNKRLAQEMAAQTGRCTGDRYCTAPTHVHGCYADLGGPCDAPHEHAPNGRRPNDG